ncbi:MAG: hypothetical protein AB1762_06390 [Gemmatimonadota bacterium]
MSNLISFPNERLARGVVAAVLAFGCAHEQPARRDSMAAIVTPPESAVAPGAGCPTSGPWQPCNVLDRLEAAGLVVTAEKEPARFPFFSVEGTTYTTTRSTIHIFLYPDVAARRRDTDALDSAAVAPRGGTYTWPNPATLVTSNNLAAVVVSPNERQMERVVLALSAGLPAGRP